MAFQEYFLYTRRQKNSDRKFFGGNFVVPVFITVTLMAVTLVDGFSCGRSCTCHKTVLNDTMEYEVVCFLPEDKTTIQEFVLTEDIFGSPPSKFLRWISDIKIVGNSDNAGRVLVRESFLQAWRRSNISLLELRNISNLSFERHTQTSFDVLEYFLGDADVTISGCNIDLLPGGLFLGKDLARLSIINSTVAVIDQGLLRNADVYHFHIKDSSIGILRGPMSTHAVTVYGPPNDSVIIENSSIALLEKDSLRFISDPSQDLNMKFNWVRVGTIEQGAITVEGFAFVQFENNVIMDFHREGLSIQRKKVHLHSNTMVTPENEISNSSYCGQGTTVRNNVLMVSDALPPSSPEALREVVSESSCLSNSIFISHESLLHPKIPKQFLTEVSVIVFFLFALCTFLLTVIIAWVVCHCYYSVKKSRSPREISIHRMRLLHHDDSMMNTFTRFQEPDLTIDITEEQQENMTTIKPETLPHPRDQTTQIEMTTNSSFSKDLNNAELKDSVDLTRKPSKEIQEPSDENSKKNISETSSIGGISSKTSEDSFQKHLDASSAKENSSEKTNEDVKLEQREIPSVEENSFEMTGEASSDLVAEY
ncbi:uncharacterized protein LOC143029687 [Oratosquilla oratoria]|uniref:uncharacterized protein LOC143029687 n=1 Tax=Oratosquilla oratoria TaxID=337810 RepID=UPI003F757CE1